MEIRKKPHATGKVKAGDTSMRVGVEQLEARGVNVKELTEKLVDAAGAEFTTYDMASRILQEEIEHEAWFIELLSKERDGKGIPSGHFRRGEPGEAPYSKNRGFYNP
jgi:ferritin-like protein